MKSHQFLPEGSIDRLYRRIERLENVLRDSIPWVAKLAADAPEAMVGGGTVVQRQLDRMNAALAETDATLEAAGQLNALTEE